MNRYIKNVKIKSLFDERDIDWDLQKINVLVGKNGLGKSTILRLIDSAVNVNLNDKLQLCNWVSVELNNGKTNTIKKDYDTYKKFINKLRSNNDLMDIIEQALDKERESLDISPEIIKELKNKILSQFTEKVEDMDSYNIDNDAPIGYLPQVSEIKGLKVEFISTVNMNANSVNNIVKSDGKHTTLLDDEISDELERLEKNCEKNREMNLKSNLIIALNSFFIETGKKISFEKYNIVVTLSNGKKLRYQDLSSGERQIIFIFLKVINGSVDKSLILMDEPEISLHLSWQEKLLNEITKANEVSQIIIVTHSPAIVMNGWFDYLTDINDIFIESNASSEFM